MYPLVLKPPFNHLVSTSSELTFSCILAHTRNFYYHFSQEVEQNKGQGAQIPGVCSNKQPSHQRNIPPPPLTNTYPVPSS